MECIVHAGPALSIVAICDWGTRFRPKYRSADWCAIFVDGIKSGQRLGVPRRCWLATMCRWHCVRGKPLRAVMMNGWQLWLGIVNKDWRGLQLPTGYRRLCRKCHYNGTKRWPLAETLRQRRHALTVNIGNRCNYTLVKHRQVTRTCTRVLSQTPRSHLYINRHIVLFSCTNIYKHRPLTSVSQIPHLRNIIIMWIILPLLETVTFAAQYRMCSIFWVRI